MSIQYDNLTNTISINDTVNANSSLNLAGQGTGPVMLKGTGQNLFTYSNTFTNPVWGLNATTVGTTVATTDPFNGSNAYKLVEDNTTNGHYTFQAPASIVGLTYTVSIYVKAAERGYALLATTTGTPTTSIQINLSTGAVTTGTGTPLNAFSTSIGNGWYRVGFSIVATATTGIQTNTYISTDGVWANRNYLGTTGSGIYVYGGQLEIASSVGTYVPTTTTTVYGTPALSFSGVAGLGLQSDGSLYVSPAGSGALQAQATTSSTAGGNARGANAVDWQTVRGSAAQVGSGQNTVIGGGTNNAATGAICGVLSGGFNGASAQYSVVAGGAANSTGQYCAGILAGQNNSAAGWFDIMVGGYANSGGSAAATTTQATTTVTSGSTAVTLSASNAAIKVGQLITGTGMANFTYVAAISGTSLTLSQNANATGTPTLSFYVPYGTVVGGGNNQATGSYSFIGGGGDAGTAGNRNVASGDWSFIGGGYKNAVSGSSSSIIGGNNNSVTGNGAVIAGGTSNTANNSSAFVGAGTSNLASGAYSAVMGGYQGTTRSINGFYALSATVNPLGFTLGSIQGGILCLGRQTTDATATVLTSDANSASTVNQVILPNNSAYYVSGSIVAGVTAGGNTSSWTFQGTIKRGANAASTVLVAAITPTLVSQDVGAATWVVAITADTTNGGLAVTVTGQLATTIRWVCKIETTEMTY